MDAVFLKLLNMSITAGWFVLAVIALRLILKKAPKAITVVLWALVGLRLILPVSFESVLSLIPSTEPLPEEIITGQSFDVNTGISFVDGPINEYLGSHYYEGVTVPENNGADAMAVLTVIWLVGMIAMLAYTGFSYFRIRRKVREAIPMQGNVYFCDRINTPFILGIFHPKIYLPSDIGEKDAEYVLAHEKAHLKRLDHWWKPLGFLLLTVYWFHPLLWVAYILLCRDIESACDEKVLKNMGSEIKKPYSEALLNCSVPRKMITACPLAFGEEGVKGRIKSVLHYKKPALWVILAAVTACIAVGVFFLTDPKTPEETKPKERFGFTATSSFPDVSIEILNFERDEQEATITFSVKNETDESITLGNSFRLLRFQDGEWKDWQHNGDYYFHSILPLLNAGESMERSFHWFAADTSMVGKYRIEFGYVLYDNWDGKRNQFVERDHVGRFEFEVTEDWGIPNYTHVYTQYNPEYVPPSEQGAELRLNYVNKRFALLNYGKVLEEGEYSTEEYLGMLTLTTDEGNKYLFIPTWEDRITFLRSHSDPIPKELLVSDTIPLSLLDWEKTHLLPVSYADTATRYRVVSEDAWSPELWLSNLVDGSGRFYIWEKAILDGGYSTMISGEWRLQDDQIVCTANDGNVYRFCWSEIYNLADKNNDGWRPERYPILEEGTSPLPFPKGEELERVY